MISKPERRKAEAMERSKVSGDELRGRYEGAAILNDVFRDIEQELRSAHRVVCQYIVNGLALEEKDEPRFAVVPLEQVQVLEYLSESTEVLLMNVIDGWLQALPELQDGCEKLAVRLKAGSTTGLLKALHDLVENCEFLVSSLSSARTVMGDTLAAGFPGTDDVEALTKKSLREAVRHLEAQDFVQLALVIEYDLNHSLEQWTSVLKDLRHRLVGREGEEAVSAAHLADRGRGSN